jgi:hypothetical protein
LLLGDEGKGQTAFISCDLRRRCRVYPSSSLLSMLKGPSWKLFVGVIVTVGLTDNVLH